MLNTSMKYVILINIKMPTNVGILTFISMINTTSECLKARKLSIFQHFSFYEQLKFHDQLSRARKKSYDSRIRKYFSILSQSNVQANQILVLNTYGSLKDSDELLKCSLETPLLVHTK